MNGSFLFSSFILVIFIKTIWMERFQLKLDWWLYCKNCKKIKKEKETKIRKKIFYFFKIISSFFCFNLVCLFTTIWSEQFQLKLDWWLHCKICKKIKKINKRKEMKIPKKYSISLKSFLFFSFQFSLLNQNNLNGTIPTQIGLMTSLQEL